MCLQPGELRLEFPVFDMLDVRYYKKLLKSVFVAGNVFLVLTNFSQEAHDEIEEDVCGDTGPKQILSTKQNN